MVQGVPVYDVRQLNAVDFENRLLSNSGFVDGNFHV